MRTPLPERHQGMYDIFFTDPPFSVAGLELFLLQGLVALRSVGDRGYLCIPSMELGGRFWGFQRFIINSGFQIIQYEGSFNEYKVRDLKPKGFQEMKFVRSITHEMRNLTLDFSDLASLRLITKDSSKIALVNSKISRLGRKNIYAFYN